MTVQLPLPGLSFAPLGGNNYVLTSGIAPMVQVRYLDGNNVLRAKLVQVPLQLTGTVTTTVDPNAITWWAFVQSGSISSPVASGTTLSLTVATAVDVISIPSTPGNFAVLQGIPCGEQAPIQAQCRSIYPLESYCQLSSAITVGVNMAIAIAPQGPPPYTSPVVTPIDGQPYVLRVIQALNDLTTIDLAFPVTLSYVDASSQPQSQNTLLLMTLQMIGIANAPNTRIIVDLVASTVIPPVPLTPPAATPELVVLSGAISVIGGQVQVQVTDAVQCGEAPTTACTLLRLPPTQEITG